MFDILRKSFSTGTVTSKYPMAEPSVSAEARGCPEIDFANWRDPRPAAAACPTGAIASLDSGETRQVTFDLGKCIFCGLCAEVDRTIRMTPRCELAATDRASLKCEARYAVDATGESRELVTELGPMACTKNDAFRDIGDRLERKIRRAFRRSLHIREVDAGSCNGCEVEVAALNSPIYDIERFGIHFVASPRHADMLLVTGPVTRNMELALRKTYEAMPPPRLVVAVGACGCSGGIFGRNYATLGGVDQVLPVDVYIPGCPPNPHALLHGILIAIDRMPDKRLPV